LALTNKSKAPLRRRWIWLASILVLLVLLLYGVFRRTPLKVRAITVQRGPMRSVISTNGKVEPVHNFEAHAPIATTVKSIPVREGDRVHKGQLLLQLDDGDIRTQAARAQAQLKTAQAYLSAPQAEVQAISNQLAKARIAQDTAQRNLDALRRLEQQGAASPGEVQKAEETLKGAQADVALYEQKQKDRYSEPEQARTQAQIADAQAAYNAAQDALGKSSVRAPFDGIVYSIPVKSGTFVEAGQLLLQAADLMHVIVRAFVDEPDIGRLQIGQKVEVTWDAVPGRIWIGTVNTVPSTVKPYLSRNVGEATCLIENQDLRLLPNVNVGVTIVVAEHTDVLTLQRDALHIDQSGTYVFRIAGDRVRRQPVQVSLQNLTRVEIVSGLSEGEAVAISAEDTKPLVDGTVIKVVP
jgi:HlyD family secretion protein